MIVIPEILELIFSYLCYPVFYPKFLLSCALVSRSWSNHALPFLWSKPFIYNRGENVRVKQIQQFRTFLSFLPDQFLKRVGLKNYTTNKFNYCYLSFIKELYYIKLYEACLEFWKNEIDNDNHDFNKMFDTENQESPSNCISNHPSTYILKNKILPIINEIYNIIILKYDAKIKYFEFSVPKKNCSCNFIPFKNYFTNFYHLNSSSNDSSNFSLRNFSTLQSFKCNGRYNYPYKELFKELIKCSKNILEIKLENFDLLEENLESIKDLIDSQKRLRSVEFEFLIKQDFSDLFDSLKEKSNLQNVRMSYCSFNKIFPIKMLSSCKNLKDLSIESCEIGYEKDYSIEEINQINPFTTLKSLKIIKSRLPKNVFDYIFSENSNLEKIIIKEMELLVKYSNIISLICLNCNQLKTLEIGLTEKTFEKILDILENCNLQELIVHDEHYEIENDDYVYIFSSLNIENHLSVSQVFRRMGKLIPYSLKRLRFTSFYYFSENDFKEFLINCGNLKYLNINICGDKVNVLNLLENHSKEINKDLIIEQWETRNYDGKNEKFHQIFSAEFTS